MKSLKETVDTISKDGRIVLNEHEVARIQQAIQDYLLTAKASDDIYSDITKKKGEVRQSLNYAELKDIAGKLAVLTASYLGSTPKSNLTKSEKELRDDYSKLFTGIDHMTNDERFEHFFDEFFCQGNEKFGDILGKKLDLDKSDTTEDVLINDGEFIHFHPLGGSNKPGKLIYVNTSLEDALKIGVEFTKLAYEFNKTVPLDQKIDLRLKPDFSIFSTNLRNDQMIFSVPDEHVLPTMGILATIYSAHPKWFEGNNNLPFIYQFDGEKGKWAVGMADKDLQPNSSYHAMLASVMQEYLSSIKKGSKELPNYKDFKSFIDMRGYSAECPILLKDSLEYIPQGLSTVFAKDDLKKVNSLPYPTLPEIESKKSKEEPKKGREMLPSEETKKPDTKKAKEEKTEQPNDESKKEEKPARKKNIICRLVDFIVGKDLGKPRAPKAEDYPILKKVNALLDRILMGKPKNKGGMEK